MRDTKFSSAVLAIVGLMGVSGVALLAAGAHEDSSGRLTTAGLFILIHGTAALAASRGALHPMGRIGVGLLLLGSILFAGDLAIRVTAGAPLLPMIAPIGGSLTMLGWLVLAIVGGRDFLLKPVK